MFAPAHDFFRAIHQAGKATRCGDHAAADRWTRIAERHLQMAKRFEDLIPKPPKVDPAERNPAIDRRPAWMSRRAE